MSYLQRTGRCLATVLGVAVTFTVQCPAQAGSLDPTFGTGGKVTSGFFGPVNMFVDPYSETRTACALQADDRVVVAGTVRSAFGGADIALARYMSDGTMDPTFGRKGEVTTHFSYEDRANAVAIDADRRIVVAGSSIASNRDFLVVRYHADGSLDSTFGSNGKVVTDFFNYHDTAHSIVIADDGSIFVAGSAYYHGWSSYAFAIARYDSNGNLDTSFGSNGRCITTFGTHDAQVNAIAIRNGRIVAAGHSGGNTSQRFTVACYTMAGIPDRSFNGGYPVQTTFSTDPRGYAQAVEIRTDGSIVVAGYGMASTIATMDFVLARYLPSGSLDMEFGVEGKVVTDIATRGQRCYAMKIDSQNRIVVAGNTATTVGGSDFALARYDSTGDLDPSFGINGIVVTELPSSLEYAYSMALGSLGRIVVAGEAGRAGGTGLAVAAYRDDGTLDGAFGGGMVVTRNEAPQSDTAWDVVAMQADGKLLAAGSSRNGDSKLGFALARFNPNGTVDSDFGIEGQVLTYFGSGHAEATAVLVQTDGKIVAVGSAWSSSTRWDIALARYLPTGTLDEDFGVDGMVTLDFGYDEWGTAVAMQKGGEIVVVGYRSGMDTHSSDICVVRCAPDGSLDGGFGVSGKSTIDIARNYDRGDDVAIQSDDKIVVAGWAYTGDAGGVDMAILRLSADGAVDFGFGSSGVALIDVSGYNEARAVAVQGDGRIVVAGQVYHSDTNRMGVALVRLSAQGALDLTFGAGGITNTYMSDTDSWQRVTAYDLVLQGDGRIVVAGAAYSNTAMSPDFAVIRYDSDGSLDPSFGTGGIVKTDFDRSTDWGYGMALQAGKIVLVGSTSGASGDTDFAVARYFVYTNVIDLLEELGGVVEGLAVVKILNHGQARSLEAKLEAALLQADRGKKATAILQLQAFMNEVNALIGARILSTTQGMSLYDRAAFMISLLV